MVHDFIAAHALPIVNVVEELRRDHVTKQQHMKSVIPHNTSVDTDDPPIACVVSLSACMCVIVNMR